MVRTLLPLLLLLLLATVSGCGLVSPEAKVRARLIEAGIKPRLANCLAPKLVAKLSTGQLEALGRLARPPAGADDDQGKRHRHSLGRLEDRLAAVDDPQTVDIVTRAAIGCAIIG